MKLIIDVPDNVYAKVMEYYEHNEIVAAVYGYIYRGIPLDKIRAEIENLNCEYIDYNTGCSAYVSQNDVLQIINNHIKGVN